ncbi:MAG: acylphosphatase [Dehalococcoidia bacterium]
MGTGRTGERVRMLAQVHGRVQGVYFRDFTVRWAQWLALVGTVRNLPDGRTVAVEAEGDRAALDRLLAALREGPPHALVERIEVHWLPARGDESGFRVTG